MPCSEVRRVGLISPASVMLYHRSLAPHTPTCREVSMPRTGIEIERPSYRGMDRWENPTPAELLHRHATDALRDATRLHQLTFYAEFALPLDTPVYCLTFAVPIDGHPYTCEVVATPALPTCPPDAPRIHLGRMPEDCLFLIPWRRRVYAEERTFCFEVRWQAETGTTHRIDYAAAMPRATVETHRAAALRLLTAQKRRGRPRGPAGFADTSEFTKMLITLIQDAHTRGMGTTQKTIATLWRPEFDSRQGDIGSTASVDVNIDHTMRLIRNHLPCSWCTLVQAAKAALESR